jgi:hypothetical protein
MIPPQLPGSPSYKTADGTEHAIKVTGETTFKGTKAELDDLKEGTEVVVRTTGKGVDETGVEIGKIGKDSNDILHGLAHCFLFR